MYTTLASTAQESKGRDSEGGLETRCYGLCDISHFLTTCSAHVCSTEPSCSLMGP
jgi:hypothetical protein